MYRFPILVFVIMLFLTGLNPAVADELTAIEIFDGMIHFEGDQLYTDPAINDYHCTVTETTVRTAIGVREIIVKDLYFMSPIIQIQLINDQPAFYFDDDLLIVLLESVELERLRDAEIGDVECYVIQTTPKDPVFEMYHRVYYVARDDFRKVRTEALHANRELDHLTTIIDYTYEPVESFTLLSGTSSETKDENGNVLANVTTAYTGYEFGINLDLEFFYGYVGDKDTTPPLN